MESPASSGRWSIIKVTGRGQGHCDGGVLLSLHAYPQWQTLSRNVPSEPVGKEGNVPRGDRRMKDPPVTKEEEVEECKVVEEVVALGPDQAAPEEGAKAPPPESHPKMTPRILRWTRIKTIFPVHRPAPTSLPTCKATPPYLQRLRSMQYRQSISILTLSPHIVCGSPGVRFDQKDLNLDVANGCISIVRDARFGTPSTPERPTTGAGARHILKENVS